MREEDDRKPVTHGPENLMFEEAAHGRLAIQRCTRCNRHLFPHRAVCPVCGHGELVATSASGFGRVYSFTVVHRAALPSLSSRTPYVVALIELDEDVRVIANIIDSPIDEVQIGSSVSVTFEALSPGFIVPQFVLSEPVSSRARCIPERGAPDDES
jgi:uncharacterized protein